MARLQARPDTMARPVAAADLVPLETHLDFLDGAFLRAQRTRRRLLGVALATAIALVALVLLGVANAVATSTDKEATAAAQARDAKIAAEAATLDRAGGFDAERLRAHASDRQARYATAVKDELDMASLLSAVRSSLPAGMSLTDVTITGIDPTAATAGTDPATPQTSGTAEPTAAGRSVTMSAGGARWADIGTWRDNLSKVAGLTLNGEPTWTGGGSDIVVTLSGQVTSAGASARASDLLTADQYGLTKAAK